MRPSALRSVLWIAPVVGGCNLIFGVQAGHLQGSGGSSSTTGTTATTGAGGATSSTSATTGTGTGGVGGTVPVCAADRIPPCGADGGFCTAQLIDTDTDADDLGLSGDDVFYTTGDTHEIRRVRYDGTGSVGFAASKATTRLVINGGHVYWTDYYGGSYVKGCGLDGAGLTTVAIMDAADQIGTHPIAADPTGAMVYWTTYSPPGLWRTSTDGAHQTPTQILAQDPAQNIDAPWGVAVDDTYLYWSDSDGLRRMKVADIGTASPPIEDFSIDASTPARAVVMDADRVYWATSFGDVRSKAKTDPPAVTPLVHQSGSSDPPLGLALDETYVYWVSLGGVVQKAAKTGATILPVAAGPALQGDSAGGLAVDCGAVYWAVPALGMTKGQVFRAAKGP